MFIDGEGGGRHEHDFEFDCVHQGMVLQRTYKRCLCGAHKLVKTEVYMPLGVFILFLGSMIGEAALMISWLVVHK
jgi:hypothetical protein